MALSNLKNAILNFPEQLKEAVEIAGDKKIEQKFEKIIVCGMGGSGLPADLVQIVTETEIQPHKNYAPDKFPQDSLVVCISYSGNTEETISCYKKAVKQGLPVTVITQGGSLKELAKKDQSLLFEVPPTNIQPRWATGYLLGILISFLENCDLTSEKKETLRQLGDILHPEGLEPVGKEIAQKTENRIPLIYSSEKNSALAYYWKIAFNENLKLHAFSNVFPETNHNEIEAFETTENPLHVILLQDETDHERLQERFRVFKSIIEKHKLELTTVSVQQRSNLEKIANFILAANWTVYHYAQIKNIDPEPVELIEEFKSLITPKDKSQ